MVAISTAKNLKNKNELSDPLRVYCTKRRIFIPRGMFERELDLLGIKYAHPDHKHNDQTQSLWVDINSIDLIREALKTKDIILNLYCK